MQLAITTPKAEAAEPPIEVARSIHASALADTIYKIEGRCAPGQSGETGCYQYLPSTWRAYSNDVAGTVLTQTPENERDVTVGKIEGWMDEGMSDRDILLMWNQGQPGPDCYKGVNDHGVAYDSCAYAAKGLKLLGE